MSLHAGNKGLVHGEFAKQIREPHERLTRIRNKTPRAVSAYLGLVVVGRICGTKYELTPSFLAIIVRLHPNGSIDGDVLPSHVVAPEGRPSVGRRFTQAVLEAFYVKDKIARAEFSEVFAPLLSRPGSTSR